MLWLIVWWLYRHKILCEFDDVRFETSQSDKGVHCDYSKDNVSPLILPQVLGQLLRTDLNGKCQHPLIARVLPIADQFHVPMGNLGEPLHLFPGLVIGVFVVVGHEPRGLRNR